MSALRSVFDAGYWCEVGANGVTKDLALAKKYYAVAAAKGVADAKAALLRLGNGFEERQSFLFPSLDLLFAFA